MGERSELIVNEAYLDRVLKILTNRKNAVLIKPSELLQVYDTECSVTIYKRKKAKLVSLDGTDFNIMIGSIGNKVYKYKNKNLDLEYTLINTELGNNVKKKYIVEKIGEEITIASYIIRGPEMVVIYYAKSNPSKDLELALYNKELKGLSDKRLVEYADQEGVGLDDEGELLSREYYNIYSPEFKLDEEDDYDYESEEYTSIYEEDTITEEIEDTEQIEKTKSHVLPETMEELRQHILSSMDSDIDDDNVDEICQDIDEESCELDDEVKDDIESYINEFSVRLNGEEIDGERKFNLLSNIAESLTSKDGNFFDIIKSIDMINKEYKAIMAKLKNVDVSDSSEERANNSDLEK